MQFKHPYRSITQTKQFAYIPSQKSMHQLPQEDLETITIRYAPLWKMLDGARLFITGGTGFFGHWLVESALHARAFFKLDFEITLLSRSPDQALNKFPHWGGLDGLFWIKGDVRYFEYPTDRFSHIIHAATDTRPQIQANSIELLDTIVNGTKHILGLAAHVNAERVLYVSSGATYGKKSEFHGYFEDELSAPDSMSPGSSYGIGKRYSEHLGILTAKTYGFDFIVARCFAFVGPGLPIDGHFAIGNFIRDALYSPSISVKSDGTSVRSYLYAADLVIWLYTLLLQAPSGRAFNVGSDQAISIHDLAHLVRDQLSPNKEIFFQGKPSIPQISDIYIPKIDRAKSELGLEVWTPLRKAIASTANWVKTSSKEN